MIASAQGWVDIKFGPNPWGSFGPAFAAVVMSLAITGGAGLKNLLRPILKWRFAPNVWLLALLGPPVLIAISIGIAMLAGIPLGAVKAVDPVESTVLFFAILVVGGPLGEEIGWRGYALPRLLRFKGPVIASLLVAAMWSLWHLPLFWMPGAAQEGTSFFWFVVLVSSFSILTTWIYLRSGGSLLAAIAFHQSINMSTYLLPEILPTMEASNTYQYIFIGATVVAAGLAIVDMAKREPSRTM
ncbi:MAG: CPBP family intramembrane glutamic endopeptidase [Arenimonas sp.]